MTTAKRQGKIIILPMEFTVYCKVYFTLGYKIKYISHNKLL